MTTLKALTIGLRLVTLFVLLPAVIVLSKSASAQDILSGHVGIAFPLVNHTSATGASNTTTIAIVLMLSFRSALE